MANLGNIEHALQEILKHAEVRKSLSSTDLTQLQNALSQIEVGGDLSIGNITQTLLNLSVSIPNSLKPTGNPHNIPRSGTAKFVGRVETLDKLHQLMQSPQSALVAIEGMGGVGKTELAIQYAQLHLLLGSYPGGICWLRARNDDMGDQIVRFAETKFDLNLPKNRTLLHQVEYCWAHWYEGNVLIILDDVNNYPSIEPYLPPQPSRFTILVTTRLQLEPISALPLNVLNEESAIELLQGWVGNRETKQQLKEVKELCYRLGYLPLALNLVGRYIEKRKISFVEMLRRLEEKGLEHPSLSVDRNDRTLTQGIERGVSAAFELSWEELKDSAQKVGCLLALFALAPIPWKLVENLNLEYDQEKLEEARIDLESLHLIQGEKSYQLHQLVREFFQDKLSLSQQSINLKEVFVKGMGEAAREAITEHVDSEVSLDIIALHIAEAAKVTGILMEDVSDSLKNLDELDLLTEAKQKWQEYLDSLNDISLGFGSFINDTVISFEDYIFNRETSSLKSYNAEASSLEEKLSSLENNKNSYLRKINEYKKNFQAYLGPLSIYETWLGSAHPVVLRHYVAYKKIEYLLARRSGNNEKLLPEDWSPKDELAKATYFEQVADFYEDNLQAIKYREQALEIKAKYVHRESLELAGYFLDLAEFCISRKERTYSINYFEKALDIKSKLLGDEHSDTLNIMKELVSFYRFCRDTSHDTGGDRETYEKTRNLWLKELEIKKRMFGCFHKEVALCMQGLGGFYIFNKKSQEAREILLECLEIKKRLFGDNHQNIRDLYRMLERIQ